MKKKLITVLLCTMMSFCLVSCGDKDSDRDSEITEEDEDSEKKISKKKDKEKDAEDESSEAKDKDSKEETKEKEPETEVAVTSDNALENWYNSDARCQLEDQINSVFESQGLTFYVDYEGDDTIIYTYVYTEMQDFGGASQEAINEYFTTSINSTASTLKNDITNYQNIYNLPVTTLRMTYLNADGSIVYTIDIDENYDPTAVETSGTASSSYASLDDWINSPEKDATAKAVNSTLESMGLSADFGADGDILEMIYRFLDYQDYSTFTEEQIYTAFDENVAPVLISSGESMSSAFYEQYHIAISDIRLLIYNSDGTLVYERLLSEME
ncbi:MAG: DUF4854 domain-containing protein [Acetatifactor sp.]